LDGIINCRSSSTAVVILYSTFGGIKTVIMTDVLQFIILTISVPLILIFMINHHGLSTLIVKIPETMTTMGGHFPIYTLLGLMLGFFLGETLIPPYVNRAFMAKDSAHAKRGFMLSGGFSIAWFFVCATIGILALVALPESAENPYLGAMKTFLPVGLLGLAVGAMISIIMSSQDSILNAASVSFNNDILATFSEKFQDSTTALKSSRWLNVAIGVVATIFALNVPSVVDALLYCYVITLSKRERNSRFVKLLS